jgi:hypothetical protein
MIKDKKDIGEFWVHNFSKHDINLGDLRCKLPARKSVNLLGRRYYYTKEQLELSAESGSLFKYKDKIKINIKYIPEKQLNTISDCPRFNSNKKRSQIKMVEPKFEELQISETEFADDLTSLDFIKDDE